MFDKEPFLEESCCFVEEIALVMTVNINEHTYQRLNNEVVLDTSKKLTVYNP